jgi:hypothetical protein
LVSPNSYFYQNAQPDDSPTYGKTSAAKRVNWGHWERYQDQKIAKLRKGVQLAVLLSDVFRIV